MFATCRGGGGALHGKNECQRSSDQGRSAGHPIDRQRRTQLRQHHLGPIHPSPFRLPAFRWAVPRRKEQNHLRALASRTVRNQRRLPRCLLGSSCRRGGRGVSSCTSVPQVVAATAAARPRLCRVCGNRLVPRTVARGKLALMVRKQALLHQPPNPSIERTSSSVLRTLPAAAHVQR